MKNKIRIVLVDDDRLLAQLLSGFLNQQSNILVEKNLNSGNELIQYLNTTEALPDLILLDLRMTDGTGVEAMEVIHVQFPDLKVIALSSYYQLSYSGHMLRLGFSSFLPKETSKEELLHVINEVVVRGHYLSHAQVMALRGQISSKKPEVHTRVKDALTSREIEVLKLLCHQYTAKEIADKLHVSKKTVETHKANLILKVGVKNTAGLIVYAIQQHFIDPEELMIL